MKESEKALLPDLYELNPATGRYRKKKKSKKNEKVKDNFVSLPSPQVATFDQPTKQQLELDQLRRELIENKERLVQLEKAKENKEQVIQPVVSSQPVVVTTTTTAKEIEEEKKEINVKNSAIKQKEQQKEEEEEEEINPTTGPRRARTTTIYEDDIEYTVIENLDELIARDQISLSAQRRNFKSVKDVENFYNNNKPTKDNDFYSLPYTEFEKDLDVNVIKLNEQFDQLNESQRAKMNTLLSKINKNEKVSFNGVKEKIRNLFLERIDIYSKQNKYSLPNPDMFKTPVKTQGTKESQPQLDTAVETTTTKENQMVKPEPNQEADPNPEDPLVQQGSQEPNEQVPIDPSMSQKTVEVPKDKYSPKYHVNSIIFYFGSSNPQWDFVLQNNLDKMDISKETVKKLCRDIVDSYGHRFLIDEVKSDGDKVELNELLQLQILFESSMIKRGSHALMKVSDLVKFQSKLAGNNKQQQQTLPQVIDGVADDAQQQQQVEQMNNNQQKAIPEQTLQNVPMQEIVTVTQSQLSADILEAYENKHTYDSGKPIITPKVSIPEEIIPVYFPDPNFSFGKRLKRKNKY